MKEIVVGAALCQQITYTCVIKTQEHVWKEVVSLAGGDLIAFRSVMITVRLMRLNLDPAITRLGGVRVDVKTSTGMTSVTSSVVAHVSFSYAQEIRHVW